jgi:Actin
MNFGILSEDDVKGREGTRKDLENDTAIVFDMGTSALRCGFAGEEDPEAILPRHGEQQGGIDSELERALRLCGLADDTEEEGGEVNLRGRSVLFSVPLFAPVGHTDLLRELAFERLGADRVHFVDAALLSLYSHGRTTGLSINWGAGMFQARAIYENYDLRESPGTAVRIDTGTHDLVRTLQESLRSRTSDPVDLDFADADFLFETAARCAPLRDVGLGALGAGGRHRAMGPICRASRARFTSLPLPPNYPTREVYAGEEKVRSFQLPDGREVRLSAAERARMTEPAFCNTDSDGSDGVPRGLADVVWRMLSASPLDVRLDLACNIACGGGLPQLPGFGARAREEIKAVLPVYTAEGEEESAHNAYSRRLRLAAPKVETSLTYGGVLATWIGGSIVASIDLDGAHWERNPVRTDT